MQHSTFACLYAIFLNRGQQFRKFPVSGLCVGFFSQHKLFRNFSLKKTYPAKYTYLYLSKQKGQQTCFAEILKSKRVYSLLLHCKRKIYVLSGNSKPCFMSLPKNRIPTPDPSSCANEQMADIVSWGSKHFPFNLCKASESLTVSEGWERGAIMFFPSYLC